MPHRPASQALRALLAGALLVAFAAPPARAGGGPAETVVLVNARSADSERVGAYFAAARGLPPSHVVRVACSTGLTVARDEFVRDVVEPLREHLRRHDAAGRIHFVVLTQGMPIRADGPGGPVSTAAALELLDTPVCGEDGSSGLRYPNPYRSGPAPEGEMRQGGRLLLVTALLSTTVDEALALVDRSCASDGTAPAGAHFVFQDADGAARRRNEHYDAARLALERAGFTTEHVASGPDVVVGRTRVLGYMSGGVYSKLGVAQVARNEYVPGALCDMLQSFGAVPQNFGDDASKWTQFPVTHMVRAGVTGVHGAVAEPYDAAFPESDLFEPYVRGYTLAETFHQKQPFRYWMNLVLGDPLCAPFARRPAVVVEGAPEGPWSGTVPLRVTAPGARAIDVYVDGVHAARIDGAEGGVRLDTLRVADGARHVLVEATGDDEAESRGWLVLRPEVQNPGVRALAFPDRVPASGEFDVALSAPFDGAAVVEAEGLSPTVRCDGATLHVQLRRDGGATPGHAVRGTLVLDGARTDFALAAAVARLAVDAPAETVAGEPLELVVRPLGADGSALADVDIELRTAHPPVRWARATTDAAGVARLRCAPWRAEALALTVSAPDAGLRAVHEVRVRTAPAHHATTPLSRFPLAQAGDVPVRIEDRFGNVVSDLAGAMSIEFPDDPHAHVPGPCALTAGPAQVVFRDVLLTRPGRQRLLIRDGEGRVRSLPTEQVEARPAALRAWLATGALQGDDAAAALAADDPAAGVSSDGAVAGGRLFLRVRAPDDDVPLADGARDGDVTVAVAFVEALADVDAKLLAAGSGRLRVLVDGVAAWDGVPPEENARRRPAPVADVHLAAGPHRVTVVAVRTGRPAFALALGDGTALQHPQLRVVGRAADDDAPVCVSGAVRRAGGRGLAGVEVVLTAADGTTLSTRSGADGRWWLRDVPAGTWSAVARPARPDAARGARDVEVADAHVTGVDFEVADRTPPRVRVSDGPRRAAQTLRVTAEVDDDAGVAEVWLACGDERLGASRTSAPWRFEVDVAGRPRGRLRVTVTARDAAGNVGTAEPVEFELVADTTGPALTLRGVSRGTTLRKSARVVADASDPLGVAGVEFTLDGVALAPLPGETAPTVALDPAALPAGRHVLRCTATDGDGNVTVRELPFRTGP